MANIDGNLLWNRKRLTLAVGATDVDTGIAQAIQIFDPGPTFGTSGVAAPVDGTPPASRIQVLPMAPTTTWADITHSEPYFNTTTGTVHVKFTNGGGGPATINVLFLDPATAAGPGSADTYH